MFSKSFSFLLLPLLCCISAERHFRFDYVYYPDINGWLKLHTIPATWWSARLRCALEGAVLASPINARMKTVMDTLWKANSSAQCDYFTGVHATFSKGDFYSIEGIPLTKLPVQWAAGEPDNANNSEECIVLTNGKIADVNCSELFPYMCYRKKTKDMVMTSCGTVDKDYELNAVTNNCYKFHRQGKTWTRAFMTCAAEGGHLAIINSNDEAIALKSIYDHHFTRILPGTFKDVVLLGFHDWGERGVWRTIHGMTIEDAGYAEWHPNQPDNTVGQDCGAMRRNAKLVDFLCSNTAPFICEKTPDSLLDDNVLE